MTLFPLKSRLLFFVACCLTAAQVFAFQTPNFTKVQTLSDNSSRDQLVADLDGDGDDDMLTVDLSLDIITVEDGVMSHASTSIGVLALAVDAGDLDGDGDLDLILGTHDNNHGPDRVYINNGSGAFTYTTALAKTSWYQSTDDVVIADVDGDGDNDILTAYGDNTVFPVAQRYLRVWLNNGSGVFTKASDGTQLFPGIPNINQDVISMSAGDLDGDGDADLMVSSPHFLDGVFLSNGDGTFTQGQSFGATRHTVHHKLGDLNGDGDLDVVFTTNNSLQHTRIHYGNGDGSFQNPVEILTSYYHLETDIADLNNDGLVDLVLSEGAHVRYAYQSPSGDFLQQAQNLDFGYGRVGRFNSDGRMDILITSLDTYTHYLWLNTNPDADHITILDPNFKAYLLANYDTNGDGGISQTEANTASGVLDCSGMNIADLTGLEHFTGVYAVKAQNNQITFVPPLTSVNLKTLWLQNNSLATLPQLTGLPELTSLFLSNNNLSQLPSLSANDELIELYCENNQLESLPLINHLVDLRFFNASDNALTVLPNLNNLTAMRHFRVGGNQLTVIPDLSYMTELQKLYIDRNQLTAIPDLAGLTALTHLYAGINQISTTPDLTDQSALSVLSLRANQLTSLPALTNQAGLTYLDAHANLLTTLPDMSGLTALGTLLVHENNLTLVPDVSANTSLTTFYIHYNDLTTDDCAEITAVINGGQVSNFVYNPTNNGYINCP